MPVVPSYLPASVAPLSLLDVFIANDELPMVRYRLRLHAPFATRTIIAESRLTHTGQPKAVYVSEGPERLTHEELARHNVRLLEIVYSEKELKKSNCSARACHNVLERRQRTAINAAIAEEIATMDPRTLIHFSDVDELLDLEAVAFIAPRAFHLNPGNATAAALRRWCVSPLMSGYQYSQHCPTPHPVWSRSVLCSGAWLRQELGGDAVLPDFAAKLVELFGEANISTVIQQKSVCLRLFARYSGVRMRKESDLAPEDLEGFQQVWDKDAPKRCYECNKAIPPGARESRCSPECRGAGKKLACRECKSTNVS